MNKLKWYKVQSFGRIRKNGIVSYTPFIPNSKICCIIKGQYYQSLILQGAPESCLAIFLPALVMGNFMVLNLFLALLLNSFNCEELKSRKEVSMELILKKYVIRKRE